jgi:hypothetical protein
MCPRKTGRGEPKGGPLPEAAKWQCWDGAKWAERTVTITPLTREALATAMVRESEEAEQAGLDRAEAAEAEDAAEQAAEQAT